MNYDTFTPLIEQQQQIPQVQQVPQQQYREQIQQPTFSQTTYNPNIPIQQEDYEYEENEFDFKKYLTMFLLILIVYFIFSLDGVKNQIGLILTCINLQEDGTISKLGYFSYGLLLAFIIVGLNILIDKFIIIKF